MVLAEIDPTLGLIAIALIGFLQAVTLIILGRNNSNTKKVKDQVEANGGESMHDRLRHMADVLFAMNRRQRAGERLASQRHYANVKRIVKVENVLGIDDPVPEYPDLINGKDD